MAFHLHPPPFEREVRANDDLERPRMARSDVNNVIVAGTLNESRERGLLPLATGSPVRNSCNCIRGTCRSRSSLPENEKMRGCKLQSCKVRQHRWHGQTKRLRRDATRVCRSATPNGTGPPGGASAWLWPASESLTGMAYRIDRHRYR